MAEVFTRARFADLATGAKERSMTATVPRREIEDAVHAAEGEPELLLDVRLSGGNGEPRVETRRVAVEWERADLQAVLQQARGENVTFSIDLDSLVRALEASDVEAHGVRETAAALTVALAVAAPSAGAALDPGADAPGIPAGYSQVEETRGAPEGIPPGFSTVEETRGAQGGTASEGIPAGFSTVEETRGAQGGTASEGIPAGFSTVEETRGARGSIPAAASDDGVTITAPGLATSLGIAGAITLAIAGAAFAARARRGMEPA